MSAAFVIDNLLTATKYGVERLVSGSVLHAILLIVNNGIRSATASTTRNSSHLIVRDLVKTSLNLRDIVTHAHRITPRETEIKADRS